MDIAIRKAGINDVDGIMSVERTGISHPWDKASIEATVKDDNKVCVVACAGDEIVGFITRGRGVTVHRKDCVNVTGLTEEEQARLIDVEWSTAALKDDGRNGKLYLAEIRIFAHNRTGLLVDITKIFTERHIDVRSVASRMSKSGTVTISYEFEVPGKDALADLIGKIRQVESVIDVRRTTG